MTTDSYNTLMDQHQAMQAQLANEPDALATETILQFLEAARTAGATIGEVRQREQLRAILRHWGGIVYDRQGEYPAVQLAPFAGSPVEQVVDATQKVRWSFKWWLLGGLAVLFTCALIFLIQNDFFFVYEPVVTPTATIDLTRPAIEVTSVVVEITETPTPRPTATRLNEEGETPASDDEEDWDNDGLFNFEEEAYGTNPYAADSDFDSVDDYIEIFELETDPLNFDTDGDGLWDGEDDHPNVPSTPSPTFTPTPLPTDTPVPPETATPQTAVPHTVQVGETLEMIAEQYGVSVAQLTALNDLSAQGQLEAGQQLFVPLNPNFIVPELVIKISVVNLRSGPGIAYTIIAYPQRGTFATVLGQTVDPTWYLVELQDGKGTRGWLSAAVVRLLYPTQPETIPLVATVPPTPAP